MQMLYGVGPEFQLRDGDEVVSGLSWISAGPNFEGKDWFEATEYGGCVHHTSKPYEFEGFPNQFLAAFAVAGVKQSHILDAEGNSITVGDCVKHAQATVDAKHNLTWTLMALSHYLPADATWTSEGGEEWSIERVAEHVSKALRSGHERHLGPLKLLALAFARRYQPDEVLAGAPTWKAITAQIDSEIERLKQSHQPGGFAVELDALLERLTDKGLAAEFVMYAASKADRKEEWFQQVIRNAAQALVDSESKHLPTSGLIHNVAAVRMFLVGTIPAAAKAATDNGDQSTRSGQSVSKNNGSRKTAPADAVAQDELEAATPILKAWKPGSVASEVNRRLTVLKILRNTLDNAKRNGDLDAAESATKKIQFVLLQIELQKNAIVAHRDSIQNALDKISTSPEHAGERVKFRQQIQGVNRLLHITDEFPEIVASMSDQRDTAYTLEAPKFNDAALDEVTASDWKFPNLDKLMKARKTVDGATSASSAPPISGWEKLRLDVLDGEIELLDLIDEHGEQHPSVVGFKKRLQILKEGLAKHDAGQPETAKQAPDGVDDLLQLEVAKAELEKASLIESHGRGHAVVAEAATRIEQLQKKLKEHRQNAQLQALFEQKYGKANVVTNSTRDSSGAPIVVPKKPSSADRRSIEQTRNLYAANYRDAEQDCAEAAAKYRAEAAQKSPDADALNDLQKRLQVAVRKSFEAQTRFQEARLHLAELDLQNVKAKLERRKTLGKQVIDRRIEDLKTGSDLSWQMTDNKNRSSKTSASATSPQQATNAKSSGDVAAGSESAATPTVTPSTEINQESQGDVRSLLASAAAELKHEIRDQETQLNAALQNISPDANEIKSLETKSQRLQTLLQELNEKISTLEQAEEDAKSDTADASVIMPPGLKVTMRLPEGVRRVGDEFQLEVNLQNASDVEINKIEAKLYVPRAYLEIRGALPAAYSQGARPRFQLTEVNFKPIRSIRPGELKTLVLMLKAEKVNPRLLVKVDVTNPEVAVIGEAQIRVPVHAADANANASVTDTSTLPQFSTPSELLDHLSDCVKNRKCYDA